MDIQEIQEKFEDLLLANPDFDESLLGKDEEGCYSDSDIQHMYSMFEAGTEVREQWQSAKAQAVPEGFVLVPEGLTHEQAARISDDENFFETYQTILTESDTSEDSAVILIQTAHKAMIKAQEPAND